MNVGVIGIGRMGLPMAHNILAAGFPLTVWNRNADRCAPLAEAGAVVAGLVDEAPGIQASVLRAMGERLQSLAV
jgi:3-hydroxyisobutyrate dehydrogenase